MKLSRFHRWDFGKYTHAKSLGCLRILLLSPFTFYCQKAPLFQWIFSPTSSLFKISVAVFLLRRVSNGQLFDLKTVKHFRRSDRRSWSCAEVENFTIVGMIEVRKGKTLWRYQGFSLVVVLNPWRNHDRMNNSIVCFFFLRGVGWL